MKKRTALPSYVWHLLFCVILMNAGKFVVQAFIAVYFSNVLKLSVWEVGTILSTSLAISQFAPTLLGFVADRVGYRRSIGFGFFLSCFGYLGYASFQQFLPLLLSSLLIGLGSAFYDPAILAAIGKLPGEKRTIAYSFYNQALNAGAISGILLGTGIMMWQNISPLWLGSFFFLAAAIYFLLSVPSLPKESDSAHLAQSWKRILHHRSFLGFTLISILYWAIYVQLTIALPLQAFSLNGNTVASGWIVLVGSLYSVICMFFLRSCFQKYSVFAVFAFGWFLMSLSFLLVPVWREIGWLFFCLFLFALGETLSLPAIDLLVARFSEERDSAAFFGVYSVSFAVGGGIGNYLGLYLMDRFAGSFLPWLAFAILGGLGILFLLEMWRRVRVEKKQISHIGG